jgi:hypothetical protein
MSVKKLAITSILILSLAANMFLVLLVFNNVYATTRITQAQQTNLKVLSFTHLFIQKVLMANQDVDFETRLTLETAVRNLNDDQILAQWQHFTTAADSQGASQEAKKLLDLLVQKIAY